MNQTFEVAVIGGGIAGAAAVISLAQEGLSVAWIRPKWKGEAHKVGESLAPAANPILERLGLSHLMENISHRRANSTFSAWGQSALVERNSAVHLEGAGSIINRIKFEQDLFDIANEACSLVVEDALQEFVELGREWQIRTSNGTKVIACFVIDATGRAQVIGKALAQEKSTQRIMGDHLVAAYAFLRQKEGSDVIATPATIIESVEDGWWYASLLPSNELTLNFYSDPDIMPKGISINLDKWKNLIQQTNQISYWIEDAEFIVDTPPQLDSAATRWLSPAAGVSGVAGWAAIGDAAVSFDPLSAHGMTTALWAAARSPDLVKAYLNGNNQILRDYADSVEKGRKEYLKQRNDIYRQEQRFADKEFWHRRR